MIVRYDLILSGAGSGERSGLPYNKIFFPIQDIPCIIHSLTTFLADDDLHHVYIVIQLEDKMMLEQHLQTYAIDLAKISIVYGGMTRQESVYSALKHVKMETVLIHDAARPFVKYRQIEELKAALVFEKAAILALPVVETLKEVDSFQQINRTIPRTKLYTAQTPQAFETQVLRAAHEAALAEQMNVTDDAQLLELYSEADVQVVAGDKLNIKITHAEDLLLANMYAAFLESKDK